MLMGPMVHSCLAKSNQIGGMSVLLLIQEGDIGPLILGLEPSLKFDCTLFQLLPGQSFSVQSFRKLLREMHQGLIPILSDFRLETAYQLRTNGGPTHGQQPMHGKIENDQGKENGHER